MTILTVILAIGVVYLSIENYLIRRSDHYHNKYLGMLQANDEYEGKLQDCERIIEMQKITISQIQKQINEAKFNVVID